MSKHGAGNLFQYSILKGKPLNVAGVGDAVEVMQWRHKM